MVMVTRELLMRGCSAKGGWSEKQAAALGTQIQNNSGWFGRLIGTEVSEDQVKLFLNLKDAHLKAKDLPDTKTRDMFNG